MSREINIDSILAVERRIAEKVAETAQLRRSRNSLLNIARVPPEILGYIFRMCVILKPAWDGDTRFDGIQAGSYDFFLVCHHWYEVAHHTPELWSFWGRNLVDWKRRCLHFETSPLDLVLDEGEGPFGTFDQTLGKALETRAARNLIRKVHLRYRDPDLLTSIISSLTPKDEGIRPSNIESIVLDRVHIANFLARRDLHKLRCLSISECPGLALDHLKSHTTALTDLSLRDNMASPWSIPTTSQILSLLASNPNIQAIALCLLVINDDVGSGYRFQVPLRHLKRFALTMGSPQALAILQRLEFPEIDRMDVCFQGCTLEGVRRVIRPYIRDRLQCDPKSKGRLGVSVSSGFGRIQIRASVAGYPNRTRDQGLPYATFTMILPQYPLREELDKLCIDILTLLPREHIVYLETNLPTSGMEELLVTAPNIEALCLVDAVLSDQFLLPRPRGPNAHKKLLPSLRWLYLEGAEAENEDWEFMVRYLTHQTSGGRPISLSVFGQGVHIHSEEQEQIRGLVDSFIYNPDPNMECSSECFTDSE
jgi:hypothetical protein